MNSKAKTAFKILPEDVYVQASQKDSALEAILKAEIEIDHSCGGFGTCGTCRVFVVQGLEKLAPRNEVEMEIAKDRNFSKEERLCCQMTPVEGLVLKKPY